MADSKNIAVLNLGSQRVSGAVFGKTGGGDLVLKRYEIVEMMGDPSVDAARLPQLKVAIEELADKLRLRKQSIWYAVAGHVVFTRFVKLPPVQGDKIDQIVEFEARQNVPFPINEVIWDYEVVSPEDAIETEVVLVAMKSDALNEIDEQVSANQVATNGVDLAPMALYNAFRYSYPDVDEPCVIIDLGARSTNLVFVEEGRMFTRNILVGGSTVTAAIAKEFQLGFGDAENQKRSQGFVALGGAVEDHSDPAVAALSKVIRNAMTRLHGEAMRTINYYRSQQGGSQPRRVFLCGGGAMLPYVVDFFQEKLRLPVEILNPLRGVQLDRGVSSEAAQGDSASLGELVGLALRSAGACPVEVELVPDAVSTRRDAARRAPLLVMAMLCLFGLLGATFAYFKNADRVVQEKVAGLESEQSELKGYADTLRNLDNELEKLKGQSKQLQEAVNDRSWWVRLLTDLNGRFENDLIWLTVVEPMKDGKSITPPLVNQGSAASPSAAPGDAGSGSAVPGAPGAPAAASPYQLHIQGLYRKNEQGQEVVYKYARSLATSEFFAVENMAERLNDFVTAETGVEEDRYAYKFDIRLPLRQPMEFIKK